MGQVLSQAQVDNNSNNLQEHEMSPSPSSIDLKCNAAVKNDISSIYDNNSEISLTDLAKEYERVGQEVIKNFGLNKLGNTIEETALTLRNLKSIHVPRFTKQRFTKLSCDCQQWNPNFRDADRKRYWNTSNKKYQCVKSDWENITIVRNHRRKHSENFLSTDFESRVQSKPLKRDYCKYCLMKMRERTSSPENEIAMKNSNDLITNASKSREKITSKKWNSSKFGESISSTNEIIIQMGKKINNRHLCLHDSEYNYRKSEFKNCPCGCGKIIEIIEKSASSEA